MALVYIDQNAVPAYTALSTDIVDGAIDGAVMVGRTVYITDTKEWYVIEADLTLASYTLPINFSGEITIGTVDQGTPGAQAWLVDNSGVTQPVSGDFLTDTELRATPVAVSGTISAEQGTDPWIVDGSAVTQPVSGDFLTDTELRATPVPISGTVVTGGLTDTQLRATPVPVSGTVSTGGLTDVQLRATPVPVLASGAVGIADGANLDAFSRLRISAPKTIFNSTFRYDLQPAIFEQVTITGGTIAHNANLVSASLTVNTANAATCILQSKQYHRYIPAKSQLIAITQVIGAAVANVRKRIGYFDADNGIFLEQNGTTDLAIVRRTKTSGSVVNNRVVQADWNLDTMDGNGASGITVDLSKASIIVIDLQWLGMGRVRFGFDIDGKIYYAHEFRNANNLTVPYMQTGTLPIRWEITNTDVSAGATMYATCSAVLSEGGDDLGESYSFSITNSANVSATTSRTPLLAIRPRELFNAITNRIEIAVDQYSVLAGSHSILVELVYNPTSLTVTGAWTNVNTTYSGVEYHPTITAISGGLVVGSFFVASSNTLRGDVSAQMSTRLPIVLDSAGTNAIPIVVCATSVTGTSDCRGRLSWRELR